MQKEKNGLGNKNSEKKLEEAEASSFFLVGIVALILLSVILLNL